MGKKIRYFSGKLGPFFSVLIFLLLIIICSPLVSQVPAPTGSWVEGRGVRFSCDEDYPPLSYLKDGEPVGFDIDIIREIGKTTGLEPSVTPDAWYRVLESLRTGTVDVVSGTLKTTDREQWFDFTIPYLIEHYAIFTRTDSGIHGVSDLPGKRLAILREDAAIESFVIPNGLDERLRETRTYSEALTLVNEGAADYTIAPYSLGRNAMDAMGMRTLVETGRSLFAVEYRFAVQKGNGELLSMLNDAVTELQLSGFLESSRRRWRFYNRPSLSTHAPPSPLFIIAGLSGFALAVGLPLWIFSLRKQVGLRTSHLSAHSARLETVLDTIPQRIVWKDRDLRYSGCNRAFLVEQGLRSRADILGRTDEEIPGLEQMDGGLSHDRRVIDTGLPVVVYEKCMNENDPDRWVRVTRLPLQDRSGTVGGILRYCEDCTEERRAQETIKSLAEELAVKNGRIQELHITDDVCDLFNRPYILKRLEEEIARFERFAQTFTIVLVELDGLFRIRHDSGYAAGDAAIRWVATSLAEGLRQVDIAGRLDGGRFMVLLPHTGAEDARTVAERVERSIRDRSPEDFGSPLTVRYGLGEYRGQGMDGVLTGVEDRLLEAQARRNSDRAVFV